MNKTLALDILERALWTAVQAFCSTWVVSAWADLTDVGLAKRAAVAAVAAALSAVKGALASRVGAGDSAATLPGG